MGAPAANEEETCYFLRLKIPRVTLENEALGKRLTLEWSGDTLPHFVEWKSMAAGDYALGLEPCTTELNDRFAYRHLAAGKSTAFRIRMTVNGIVCMGSRTKLSGFLLRFAPRRMRRPHSRKDGTERACLPARERCSGAVWRT